MRRGVWALRFIRKSSPRNGKRRDGGCEQRFFKRDFHRRSFSSTIELCEKRTAVLSKGGAGRQREYATLLLNLRTLRRPVNAGRRSYIRR